MIFLPKSTNFKEIIYNLALVLLHNSLWSMALSFVIFSLDIILIAGLEEGNKNEEMGSCTSVIRFPRFCISNTL